MRALLERARDGRADKYLGLVRVGLQAGFRVLLGILVARVGGPAVFATFVQLVTIEIVAHTLWTAAFVTPLGSLAPGLPAAQRGAFVAYALRRNRSAAVRTGVAFGLGTPVAAHMGVTPVVWLGFCVSTVAWLEANAAIGALAAGFRSGRAALATLVGFGLPTAAVLVAHVRGLDLLATFFWANAAGHGCAAIWVRASLDRTTAREPVTDELHCAFRRFGRVAIVGSAANSACTRVQPFVLGMVADALAVGLYGAANTLTGPVRVVGGALGEVLRPRLALHLGAEGEFARARRAFTLAVSAVVVTGVGLWVVAVGAGDVLAQTVFGPEYDGLGRVLPAAVVFVVLATLDHLLVVAMQTANRNGPAAATRLRIRAALLSIALVAPACVLDGARGAFTAMAVAELAFLAAGSSWLRAHVRWESTCQLADSPVTVGGA